MKPSDLGTLKQAFDDVQKTKEELFQFRLQTKISLLTSQFQLFQSLATIILAFWAILITTTSFKVSPFFVISLLCSAVLIVFTLSFIRECIDGEDKALHEAQENINKMGEEVSAKIEEAIKTQDIGTWETYIKEQNRAPESPELNYAPEIAMFLFTMSLLFAVVALLEPTQFFRNVFTAVPKAYAFILPISISIVLSATNWSKGISGAISRVLQLKV